MHNPLTLITIKAERRGRMDENKVQQLFETKLSQDNKGEGWHFKVGDKWLNLTAEMLTNREKMLLKLMQKPSFPVQHSPWADYLLRRQKKPVSTGKFRFLQFKIKPLSQNFVMETFLAALKKMFVFPPEDVILLALNRGVVVEKITPTSLTKEDLIGVMQTLEDDFECQSRLFVGHSWEAGDDLARLFKAEEKVFVTIRAPKKVFNFTAVSLDYFTNLDQDYLAQKYYAALTQEQTLAPMITALYQHKGNISSAAKALYVHRNTLQYQIDKLAQETGLNLREMDDLVFCYLILHAQHSA